MNSNNNIGFLIRFVNWKNVHTYYIKGKYTKPNSISFSSLVIKTINLKKDKLSSDPEDDKYSITTRDGSEITIYTTNCPLYNNLKNKSVLCGWCRTSLPLDREGNTPIVLKLNISYPLVDNVRKRLIKIRGERANCDFHCAIALAKKEYSSEVEENIRLLHQIMYPNSGMLKEAPNYVLLDINCGSMSYETFKNSQNHIFIELNGFIINHVKRSIAAL